MLETIRRINSLPRRDQFLLRFSEHPWRALPAKQVQGPYPAGIPGSSAASWRYCAGYCGSPPAGRATGDDVLLAPHWRSSRALFSQLVEKEQ